MPLLYQTLQKEPCDSKGYTHNNVAMALAPVQRRSTDEAGSEVVGPTVMMMLEDEIARLFLHDATVSQQLDVQIARIFPCFHVLHAATGLSHQSKTQ